MRPVLLVVALFSLATCSATATSNCVCDVTVDTDDVTLTCGQTTCIDGLEINCDISGANQIGSCGLPDGFGDGFDLSGVDLLPLYAACDPSTATCQPITNDGGTIEPTCDPTTRRCCVPIGNYCTGSFDCCEGHECVDTLVSEEGDGGYASPRHCGN